jgi:hypothetical protein
MLAFAEKHNQLMREKQAAQQAGDNLPTDSTSADDKIVAKASPIIAIKPEEE